MSALRVVLLAEGSGEVGWNALRGPGSRIAPEDWGPAHTLFARAIEERVGIPRRAVEYREPQRTARGVIPRGSDLHRTTTLRRLLTYFLPTDQPDLAIVLVDEDGVARRAAELTSALQDIPTASLVAVAVREFEAWLLSDARALAEVVNCHPSRSPPRPEELNPSEAKGLLKELCSSVEDPRRARLSLAENLELKTLAAKCPSFDAALTALQGLRRR